MKNNIIILVLFLISTPIYGQQNNYLLIDESDIVKQRKEHSITIFNITDIVKHATIDSSKVEYLYKDQTIASVTNQLGKPLFKSRVIDLETSKTSSTQNWQLVYMHTENNRIYYKMLFSGKANQPDKLINVEAFVTLEKGRISIGMLELRSNPQ